MILTFLNGIWGHDIFAWNEYSPTLNNGHSSIILGRPFDQPCVMQANIMASCLVGAKPLPKSMLEYS